MEEFEADAGRLLAELNSAVHAGAQERAEASIEALTEFSDDAWPRCSRRGSWPLARKGGPIRLNADEIAGLHETINQSLAEARAWLVETGGVEDDARAALSSCAA